MSGGFVSPAFQWQQNFNGSAWTDIPGEVTLAMSRSFTATSLPGKYQFRLSVAEAGNMASQSCRIASTPLVITVNSKPATSVTSNNVHCVGDDLILSASGGSAYSWNGPAGFTGVGSQVTVSDVAQNFSGKYYVVVENEFSCQRKDSILVNIDPSPIAGVLQTDLQICQGQSVTLGASGGGDYNWQPNFGLSDGNIATPLASPASTVKYTVSVTNNFMCADTASVNVDVLQLPVANAGADRAMIQGTPIKLAGNIEGQNVSYNWTSTGSISDRSILQPTVNPDVDTKYVLNASSQCGSDSDTMLVKVYKGIHIPSAFTPNGDGINDTWNIPALSAFSAFSLSVFNRFGERIFFARNENRSWDGKFKGRDLATGTYVYVLSVDRMPVAKGSISLFR